MLINFHKHNNASANTSVDRRITYGINAVIDGMQAEFAADMRPFTMDNRTFLSLRAMPISIFIEDVRQLRIEIEFLSSRQSNIAYAFQGFLE